MQPMTDPNELQAMQSLLAHHERQLQDLSDIVTAQRAELDRIRLLLEKTGRKLAEVELAVIETGQEDLSVTEQALRDKPPHY